MTTLLKFMPESSAWHCPSTRCPRRTTTLRGSRIFRGIAISVCPGSLAEQWQDELYRRFHLPFEILTNDKLEAARTANWFSETNLVIARLDKLSRNEDVQQKLSAPDCRWDLIVCDEAHKMSATYFGGEIKFTKRYRLGQLLSGLTRHFLLMTATPHNGKEEDFQLFMALLDGDRFEGRFRDGAHVADVSDLMRRMVKEKLLKFDATPLFPERIAHTVPYKLSQSEAQLYKAVTEYVTDEFNRAEALQNDKRSGTVGFALTIGSRCANARQDASQRPIESFPLLCGMHTVDSFLPIQRVPNALKRRRSY
jgi:SNF2 family DNA or RNA helicase